MESGLRDMQRAAKRAEVIELTAMPDGKDLSGRYLMLEALNLNYVGPNMRLAVETKPGDGHFEVVLVSETERDRLVHYLEHWQENRERLAVLPTLHGRRLQIEWTGFALHIDDKLRPKADAKPRKMAGVVEARLQDDVVEFLVPA